MRRLILAALLGACLFAAQPARAQIADNSVTVGTSAALALAAATTRQRVWLYMQNRSANAISCSWTTVSPTVRGAGTFTLPTQDSTLAIQFPSIMPSDAIYCIASGAGSGLTILSIP